MNKILDHKPMERQKLKYTKILKLINYNTNLHLNMVARKKKLFQTLNYCFK